MRNRSSSGAASLVVTSIMFGGCYLSHEQTTDGRPPTDAARPRMDTAVVGEVGGGCDNPWDCARDERCDGPCSGGGVCVLRPMDCTGELPIEVCGCDGERYPHACAAHSAGVSVAGDALCGIRRAECAIDESECRMPRGAAACPGAPVPVLGEECDRNAIICFYCVDQVWRGAALTRSCRSGGWAGGDTDCTGRGP